jgi:hypothetical protein
MILMFDPDVAVEYVAKSGWDLPDGIVPLLDAFIPDLTASPADGYRTHVR